ncbi:FKBP-type peptidyl-prolyl cis-trans isomerase [uncultured Chitinophaga sp.]|jgi:FKBP-type peptidyl-prolyl cis-trans isomerases 1|uniref:FKBP-type peptidyl-prolyl cis-trans isomerase n=1 Tax=uncultured Chitinophaga sp. TaxID=339340 RepID=UPI002606B9E4|nr:FKBP-type peptidyl-prolyl cis-trans isomerase [uncultured Chitinophaga sp.]
MKQVLQAILSLFLGLILFSACAKKDNVTLLEDAGTFADDQIEQYLRSHNINATRDLTGLYYQILDPGDSVHYMLSMDNIPTIIYTRRLLNDKLVDVSLAPTNFNNRPLKDHIAGWQIGLQKIAKGGKILLIIPPSLGFGNVKVDDKIPANSVLVCELTLVDFK